MNLLGLNEGRTRCRGGSLGIYWGSSGPKGGPKRIQDSRRSRIIMGIIKIESSKGVPRGPQGWPRQPRLPRRYRGHRKSKQSKGVPGEHYNTGVRTLERTLGRTLRRALGRSLGRTLGWTLGAPSGYLRADILGQITLTLAWPWGGSTW